MLGPSSMLNIYYAGHVIIVMTRWIGVIIRPACRYSQSYFMFLIQFQHNIIYFVAARGRRLFSGSQKLPIILRNRFNALSRSARTQFLNARPASLTLNMTIGDTVIELLEKQALIVFASNDINSWLRLAEKATIVKFIND